MPHKKGNKTSVDGKFIYEGKDIKIYSDFDSASEAEIEYVLNQEPLDRIKETVQLILRIYSKGSDQLLSKKIHVDRS